MANDAKITVLVADDEPSTLALLSRHLRSKGYSVFEASDGDQAWELAHQHLPHLVVLDVMMPGMSGWEVCRKIREAVSLAHTGVIMLTGIGERLNEMTSPLYGADAHIDKPFEFSDLDRKMQETLQRRNAGTMGRPDRAQEQNGSVAMQREPIAARAPSEPPLAKPPVKARPKSASARREPAAAPPERAQPSPAGKRKLAPTKASRKAKPRVKAAPPARPAAKPTKLAKKSKKKRAAKATARKSGVAKKGARTRAAKAAAKPVRAAKRKGKGKGAPAAKQRKPARKSKKR